MQLVSAALEAEEYSLAVDAARQAVLLHPRSAVLHAYLAMALQQAGDKEQAQKALEEAVSLNERHPLVQRAAAWSCYQQGEYEEAIFWLEKLLLRFGSGEAHYWMAVCLEETGRSAEAGYHYQRAAQLGYTPAASGRS
ncbi:MAG: tetratricopeptide repeat protein [Deltaproteobacteria bacterium]|nr:tetratricopeptide repeat protein [Deltaproteobacteria bacterium]